MQNILITVLSWIGTALPWIKQLLDIFKGGLEGAKIAQDMFHKGTEDLQAATDADESTHLERVQAASELMRSYAWVVGIEAAFRFGMAALVLSIFKEAMKALRKPQ